MGSKNHKSKMVFRCACILVSIILTGILWSGPVRAEAGGYPLSGVDRRLLMEQVARDNPFLLLPHRPNYILPLAYWFEPNEEPFGLQHGSFDKMEMKFQVSLKLLISEDLFGGAGDLYAAYTNRSWWQTYNAQRSRPFRETNHEPELFLFYDVDIDMLGFTATNFVVGVSHQSNGQGGALSRSWNRVYGMMILEKNNLVLSFKPWYRIPEDRKISLDDPGGDDNPDIRKYMGSAEVRLFYKYEKHSFSIMARNNLRKDQNKGALELGWTYPMSSKVKGYLQVFDGYGESLIDYDHRATRVGVGILLADWL